MLLTRNPRVDLLGDRVDDSGSVRVDALGLQPVPELVAVLHGVHLRNVAPQAEAKDRQAGRHEERKKIGTRPIPPNEERRDVRKKPSPLQAVK